MSSHGSAVDTSEADSVRNQENRVTLRSAAKNRLENQENINPRPSGKTVLGVLENNPRQQPALRGYKQANVSHSLPCRSEDHGKSYAEKPPAKQPAFQIHWVSSRVWTGALRGSVVLDFVRPFLTAALCPAHSGSDQRAATIGLFRSL
ncbi:hypothetical protein SRHO_G00322990 [Serrasalmus rhombeus]